jgi:Flp pilus assembly protein TadG
MKELLERGTKRNGSRPGRPGTNPRIAGCRRPERGQALLEFALVLPMLAFLFLGIVEVGRIAYYAIEVRSAARAGVAYGAQNHATAADNTGMAQAALNESPEVPGLGATGSHFCKCADGSSSTCASNGCSASHTEAYVQVQTSATVNTLFGFPQKSVKLAGNAIMRVTQ